ncbi:MAG: hypothetical protein ACR2N9_10575 [Acidimicrobiia bacterium]
MQDQSPTHRRRRRLIAVFSVVLVFASAAAIGALLMRAPITGDITTADYSMQVVHSSNLDTSATLQTATNGSGTCGADLVANGDGEITFVWDGVWDGSECIIGGYGDLAVLNDGTLPIQVQGLAGDNASLGDGKAFEVVLYAADDDDPTTGLIDGANPLSISPATYRYIFVVVSAVPDLADAGTAYLGLTGLEIDVAPYLGP